jgi:tRNA A37 threonylcarbamoyladenosine dehydratase
VATRADVGLPKVVVMKKYFKAICPQTKVDALVELFSKESATDLLGGRRSLEEKESTFGSNDLCFFLFGPGQPDYVVDCIDNIDTKLALIQYCHERKIKVISSMGSGAKADPSRIQIADISETKGNSLCFSFMDTGDRL